MSLKHVDIESAMRRLAERRIEEAMREGKFANLKGAGKPLDLEPAPADENARMTWWALRILRQNDVVPEELQIRKRIDTLKSMLPRAEDEAGVHMLVEQINDLVKKLNTLGTNAVNLAIAPVVLETELRKLHERLIPLPPTFDEAKSILHGVIRHCGNTRCKSRNPLSAKFCRRCGEELV